MRGFAKIQKDMTSQLSVEQKALYEAAHAAKKDYEIRVQTASWDTPLGSDITKEEANAKIEAWNAVSPISGLQVTKL